MNIYLHTHERLYRNVDQARVSQLEDRLQHPVQSNAMLPVSQFTELSSAASAASGAMKVWWNETEDYLWDGFIYVLSISETFQNDVCFFL